MIKKACFLLIFLFCSVAIAEDRNLYDVTGDGIQLRGIIGHFDVWNVTENFDGTFTYTIAATEEELLILNGYDIDTSMRLTSVELKAALEGVDKSVYHTYQDVLNFLSDIQLDYPDIAQVYEIGVSIEGLPVMALKISSSPDFNHPDKTEVVFVSLHHAKEWPTIEFAIALAEELTENYSTDPEIFSMVNDSEIWIIPVLNPDGYIFSYNENGIGAVSWRKNRRPNYGGSYNTPCNNNEDCENTMECSPNNVCVYYGVDLNRNYSYRWTNGFDSPSVDTYAGTAAFSEPETTALRNLIGDLTLPAEDNLRLIDNADGLISYHTHGSQILYPYSYDVVQPETLNELLLIGNQMAEMSGYKLLISSDPVEMYSSPGDTADWFYVNSGFKPAYTIEMRASVSNENCAFILDEDELNLAINENLPAALFFIKYLNDKKNDTDGDGVPDIYDNCPGEWNGFEAMRDSHMEIIQGASALGNGYWKQEGHLEKVYMWQPDHDLDGIGDACDLINESGTGGGYSISYSWKKSGSLNKSTLAASAGMFLEVNRTIPVSVAGGYYSPVQIQCFELPGGGEVCDYVDASHRVHYCGLDLEEYCFNNDVNDDQTGCKSSTLNRWSSNCQVEPMTVAGVSSTTGRSHATVDDPFANVGERWPHIAWDADPKKAAAIKYDETGQHKGPVTAPSLSVAEMLTSANWNWRADIYAQYNCAVRFDDYAICKDDDGGIKQDTPVYYTLSSNLAGESGDYTIEVNNVDRINPEYFKNFFTRPYQGESEYNDIGKWAMATRLNTGYSVVKYRTNTSFLTVDELKNSYKSFIGMSIPKDSAANIIVPLETLVFEDVSFIKYRNGGYIKTGVADHSLVSSVISFIPKTRQLIEGDRPGVTYAIAETGDEVYDLSVNYAPSSDWHRMGRVFNYETYDLEWSTAAVHDRTIYLSEKDEAAPSASVYRIVRNGSNYQIQHVLRIPLDGVSDIRLISAMGSLYFFENSNGLLKSWSIDLETETYADITSGMTPVYINPFNIIGTETGIYIAGKYDPANPDNTIIAKLSDSNGWQIVHSNVNANTDKLIMNVIDGKVVMTDILSDNPVTTRMVLDMTDNSLNIEEIETPDIYGMDEDLDKYCLNETGNLIKGGLEELGTCMPFTYPWYRSFATGSTIYSVAGKGDRLYVGTNNSIKVYDISDPEALVLKSTFSTGGRIVYDLEVVEGDIMYAATSGGIYKLDTANPDTLASLSFFATSYNYQYRIQLYNDKLYVGDDNGINIRDKETFTRLAYVNIDSVLDFAIANGEIALYRSSFWSAGLHIRDVETLNLKAYEYAECYTGELTTDHGAFYLSCDGYEYRFEGRPDTYFNFYPLDGDMREMQENHVYNGWTYIPDGSNVKLSTLNDVPSYCGNGVIEEGELCDGNSVQCATLDPDYTGGTAACNSTCDGYNESYCEEDGW